ncbi:MAG: hypothetical protein QM723_14975 [Myxococcaceae bacterium]
MGAALKVAASFAVGFAIAGLIAWTSRHHTPGNGCAPGSSCVLKGAANASFDCLSGNNCQVECGAGCTTRCVNDSVCSGSCGAGCRFSCGERSMCKVTLGSGTLDCSGGSTCALTCDGGPCALHCAADSHCTCLGAGCS